MRSGGVKNSWSWLSQKSDDSYTFALIAVWQCFLNGSISILCSILTLFTVGSVCQADDSNGLEGPSRRPPRARYSVPTGESTLRFTPVNLSDGSKLTLISPSAWSDLSEEISSELTNTHRQLTTLFGAVPPFRTAVRLIDEQSFYQLTGAPSWTNAMFFKGEIIIPLSTSEAIDLDNLHRSIKHEYSHAVLSALSGGLIPGWLDEGLAQWLEGEENPALRNTLRSYLTKSDPVPLHFLQGGFTKLTPQMVPAAYAQSLLAVQALLKVYGVEKVGIYLSLLRQQMAKARAFEISFGLTESDFEDRLRSTLRTWAGTKKTLGPQTLISAKR